MTKPEAKSKIPWATMEPRRRTAHQWRQPRSQRAMQPIWRHGRIIIVSPCWNYQPCGQYWGKNCVDHLLCQTITWQATDGWLHHRIFGLSTIGNKRLQICSFRSSGYIIITFQFNYLKTVLSTVYQCLAFSYAGPALNYFESRSATISNISQEIP